MSIEKGIRAFALQLPSHLPADENSVDGNDDLGFLDTTKRPGKIDFFSIKGHEIPEEITLTVRLRPLPFEEKATTFQMKVNEKLYPSKQYYGLEALSQKQQGHRQYSQYQAIELLYEGQGSYLMKGERAPLSAANLSLNVQEGQPLLRKTFLVQKAPTLMVRKRYLGNSEWLMTPPYGRAMINGYSLLAYGGYYKPGLPLSRISQIFASIDDEDDIPLLTLHSQRDLEEKRLPPPRSGYIFHNLYHYIDTFQEDDLLNLEGHIQGGKSIVSLASSEGQADSKEASSTHRYRSYRYTQLDPASGLLDLHFKPDNASF